MNKFTKEIICMGFSPKAIIFELLKASILKQVGQDLDIQVERTMQNQGCLLLQKKCLIQKMNYLFRIKSESNIN